MNTMKTSENTIMLPGINVNMFFFRMIQIGHPEREMLYFHIFICNFLSNVS